MAIQLGDVLGDYKVIGVLGRGGMGKVFRVRSLLTDREEAMKVLLPDLDENPDLADRFLREIKVHARLHHPNIAALRTALRIDERLYMVVELVEGSSLGEKLREGPLPVPAAVAYTTQALSALSYAHGCGVIHRDIKPANLLIGNDGAVKLTDFGVARAIDATGLTSMGLAVGTLAYMSPEQVRAEPVDARSDLYSLGLTFYEMVTGRRAIPGDTAHSIMSAQLMTMPTEPVAVNPSVPRWISALIMRALAKEPDRRFQSADELKAALTDDSTRDYVVAPLPIAPLPTAPLASAPPAITSLPITPLPSAPLPTTPSVAGAYTPGAQVPAAAAPSHPGSFEPATIDRLAQALAPYLGPIAKVLVNRAARRARNLNELQEALAAEIPSADDRRRFLARVRSPF
jgi:eukaryotic-like serine/threonine-protein kinase